MKVMNLCRNCSKHYLYFADDGSVLAEGCHLDLPLFHPRKAVVFSSYLDTHKGELG